VLTLLTLVGIYQEAQQQWFKNLPSTLPGSPGLWFFLTLILFCILLLEGAYRYIRCIRKAAGEREESLLNERNGLAEELKSLEDNPANIALELESTNVLLNGAETSIARIFWGLRDCFADGLGKQTIPQLLSIRFQENNLSVGTIIQTELITQLTMKKLISTEQRPITRYGNDTYYSSTPLGNDVLDRLNKRFKDYKL